MQQNTNHEIEQLKPWFHNLHLPDGNQTAPEHPLGDFPRRKWRQIAPHLPADLSGWKAIDIGCNAGFYSFELARRGATVTAIDIDGHYLAQARWAAQRYGLSHRIKFHQMQVYEVPRLGASFDLVLFMGVFYHLRFPFLALNLLAGTVKRMMVFQTMTLPGGDTLDSDSDPNPDLEERDVLLDIRWPKMAFVEHRLAHDPTNWWVPNHSCVEAMLRSSGLDIVANPAHEIYFCVPKVERRDPNLAEEIRCAAGLPGQIDSRTIAKD